MNKSTAIGKLFLLSTLLILTLQCRERAGTRSTSASNAQNEPVVTVDPIEDPFLREVYYETPADANDPNRFNADNTLYPIGKSYYYEVQYRDKEGRERWIEVLDWNALDDWRWVEGSKPVAMSPTGVRMVVQSSPNSFNQAFPDAKVSVAAYEYLTDQGPIQQVELVALVENARNIYLTPPRSFHFKVLEFSPYPYVKFPLDSIRKWADRRLIAHSFSDTALIAWPKGLLVGRFTYYNRGKVLLNTQHMGKLRCHWIRGIGAYGTGHTCSADFYFHPKYGFVRMRFLNVDSSSTAFELYRVD